MGGKEKDRKNSKKASKIALLSLCLHYLYHIWKSRGARFPCRRPSEATIVIKIVCSWI